MKKNCKKRVTNILNTVKRSKRIKTEKRNEILHKKSLTTFIKAVSVELKKQN